MTARVKKVIEELAELSPPEMAEVVTRFRELRSVDEGGRAVCRNADLILGIADRFEHLHRRRARRSGAQVAVVL
ncbi:MAG TPA: hypothetical protein VHM31_25105 [Polyangia bacterium]|nr:hypothetical protein [Polyangia bacterium]